MIPVRQTLFGGKDAPDAEKGNCFTACVASLFEVPLESLPHLILLGDADGTGWWERTNAYLIKRFGAQLGSTPDRAWLHHDALTIASGPGPRGHQHSVLYDGSGLVHDPHPSDAGLLDVASHDVVVIVHGHGRLSGGDDG